jgi:hypothetical protein
VPGAEVADQGHADDGDWIGAGAFDGLACKPAAAFGRAARLKNRRSNEAAYI